jgi:hypothetical protein
MTGWNINDFAISKITEIIEFKKNYWLNCNGGEPTEETARFSEWEERFQTYIEKPNSGFISLNNDELAS